MYDSRCPFFKATAVSLRYSRNFSSKHAILSKAQHPHETDWLQELWLSDSVRRGWMNHRPLSITEGGVPYHTLARYAAKVCESGFPVK